MFNGWKEAYQSIDWKIILVLAGLLPLGEAMANSGAAQFIVDNTLGKVGEFGPLVVLAVLYLLTMVLTEFMSNAGTAVLLTPIAVSTAKMLGVDASPFIIAVMFAAATSFMTLLAIKPTRWYTVQVAINSQILLKLVYR